MKVNVLEKEEKFRARHINLTLQVEEAERIYEIKVYVIEEYDVQHNKYSYEFEGYSWLTNTEGINANEMEVKVENYLVDNIEDILA